MKYALSKGIKQSQHGVTLIELMIALVLGLVLTGGALQVFISSKESYRVTESNSQLLQSGKIGLEFITKSLNMAGFFSGFSNTSSLFPVDTTFTTAGQVITGGDSTVSVRYYGYTDPLVADCQGNPIASGSYGTMTYYLDVTDSTNKKLMCKVTGIANDVVVVENVEQLQFRYGLSTNKSNLVDRYTKAASVSNWSDVRSVRIGMLVKSGIKANSTQNTRTYTLFDQTYATNDNFVRETFITTAGLWNVMQ